MKKIDHTHLPVVAISDAGKKGKNNEDRFAVSAFQASENDPTPVLLAVVCDGIGGHRAGEIAAEIAVNSICTSLAQGGVDEPIERLRQAICLASEQIILEAQKEPERQGMGATAAVLWIIGTCVYTAYVGDSRIYLLRGGTIRQLSTDHTWIQEALEAGLISPEQVKGHPNAHVIRRYLGSPTPPEVDLRLHLMPEESDAQALSNQGMSLQENDCLLLCSDGLTDLVQSDEIAKLLQENPLEDATQALVNLANERGGHDNITVVTIFNQATPTQQLGVKPPEPARAKPSFWRNWGWSCLAALLLALIVMGVVLGLIWIRDRQLNQLLITSQTPNPMQETQAKSPLMPVPGQGTSLPLQNPTVTFAAPAQTLTPWPTNTPAK